MGEAVSPKDATPPPQRKRQRKYAKPPRCRDLNCNRPGVYHPYIRVSPLKSPPPSQAKGWPVDFHQVNVHVCRKHGRSLQAWDTPGFSDGLLHEEGWQELEMELTRRGLSLPDRESARVGLSRRA